MTSLPQNTARYNIARQLTLLSYFVLIGVLFYGCWFLGPETAAAKIVLWLFVVSGLLLVVNGLLRGQKRSYVWLCFILLMYFVLCVQFLFSGAAVDAETGVIISTAASHEIVAMVAIVVGFISAMYASRWV